MIAQLLSRFGVQVLPAVCASILSAAVLAAFQLSPGTSSQGQRATADLYDDTVYIDVLPKINREPSPPTAPVKPVVAVEAPAPAPQAQTPAVMTAGHEHAPRPAARTSATTTAKVEPAPKAATAPKNEPLSITPSLNTEAALMPPPAAQPPVVASAPRAETVAALSPPLPIGEAPVPNAQVPDEPSRVLGMRVPRSVSDAGGAVVDVAKLPIQFADTLVARPVWRVGEKIVTGVAGWVGGR